MMVKLEVWVATQGCYSDKYVVGVFASPEVAMKVLPGENWEGDGFGGWNNELDWDEYVTIRPYKVVKS